MSIRVVDPTCFECGAPLTDPASRAFRLGPECRKGMSLEQLRAATERAAEADDPFRIPEERAPSRTALVNNHNARAAAAPDGVQVCVRHGGELGKCALCDWEAAPENAAALVLREVRSWTFAERRAERARVLAARYAHVTVWRPAVRPQKPEKAPTPTRDHPRRSTRPRGQLEFL